MNKKCFSLFFIIAFPIWMFSSRHSLISDSGGCCTAEVKLNNANAATSFIDSAKNAPAGEYAGKDSTFVKGGKIATGLLICPTVKNTAGGAVVFLSYRVEKKRGKLVLSTASLGVAAYNKTIGATPMKVLSSNSVLRGDKISFSLSTVDTIARHKSPWAIGATVYGTYDTSNGKYSIQIYQYTPDDMK